MNGDTPISGKSMVGESVVEASRKWVGEVFQDGQNNMKGKNRDLDSYYTKLRAPFESVFSKQNKRVRYRGIAKNQFSAFMQAITFNFKRLVVLSQQYQEGRPPITA